MQKHLVLLRGINVGGHRKVPMAQLRALAGQAGYGGVETYIASGNLILESTSPGPALEAHMEQIIADHFGFPVDVIVRSQAQWNRYLHANPFPAESSASPNLVMICIGKNPATDDDRRALAARAGANEKVERTHDVLWLYFGDGPARSKMALGPGKAPWTTRNIATVHRLAEMMNA